MARRWTCRAAIAAVTPLLPPGCRRRLRFRKSNPADQPIIFLSLISDTLPMSTLDEYAETQAAPRISMINGVAQVQVQGQQKYAVRVQIDPDKLAAKHIGLNEIDTALNQWNINHAAGNIVRAAKSIINVHANGQLMNAEQFRNSIISYAKRSAGVSARHRQRDRQRAGR